MNSISRSGMRFVSASIIFFGLAIASTTAMATPKPFSIDSQEAPRALLEFGRQSTLQILFASEQVKGIVTRAVHGSYEPIDALRLMLRGTPLVISEKPDGVLVVESQAKAHLSSDANPVIDGDADSASRLAQFTPSSDQSQTEPVGPKDSDLTQSKFKDAKTQLEEIVVTGSHLRPAAEGGAQEVKTYSRQQIDQSGQSTVSDFLNTLPDISVSIGENGFQTVGGATTVQVHGLPVGTTLVLIDGRRLEPSALEGALGGSEFFDLNNIPLAAVERIDVLPEGSSAIYGSDAIAGVVNIILKRNFNGIEANAKYGAAEGTDDRFADLAAGKTWDRGSVSVVLNVESRGALSGFDRAATANSYEEQGNCDPGEVFSVNGQPLPGLGTATYAAVPAGFTGKPTIATFASTAGVMSQCRAFRYASNIPQTQREGVLINGTFEISSSVEVFADVLYSHVEQTQNYIPPNLYGLPTAGYSQFTVGASNPFNPFGEAVGVAYTFGTQPTTADIAHTEFVQPVLGLRGSFLQDWHWEASAYESRDREYYSVLRGGLNDAAIQSALNSANPATALNPFTTGAPASQQILNGFFPDNDQTSTAGQTVVVSGSLNGTLVRLPSGAVQLAFGGEYDRDTLSSDLINLVPYFAANTQSTFHRNRYAVFAESRIPIIGNASQSQTGETLVATLAGRFDHYDDFGKKVTPQFGVEWRPYETLLLRDSYSRSFKAPSLFDLHSPQYVGVGDNVVDPQRGNADEIVTVTTGGNPNLKPETGRSNSIGFVYTSKAIPNLQLSVTHWDIRLDNAIQSLGVQIIVDNENLFPGEVVRAPTCNSGPPCPITAVNATYSNFGEINVAGFDYQLNYKYPTKFGLLSPSLSATQTYRYQTLLTPGSPVVDAAGTAQDDGDWAPKWKATVAMGWKQGPYSANVVGRYVGTYQDYDSTNKIGNFWFCDANVRYAIGQAFYSGHPYLEGAYVELGAVNLLDAQPQHSNYEQGLLGYDPAEADIRRRFVYGRIGIKL